MLKANDFKDLTNDFYSWGKSAVRRVLKLTEKHGTICSSAQFSNGRKG